MNRLIIELNFIFITKNKLKFYKKVDHKNSIITLQALSRVRAVLSLLGLISQTQPKRYSYQSTKGLECFHIKQPVVDIYQ